MSEIERTSLVSDADIRHLTRLYDNYANTLVPNTNQADEAERAFFEALSCAWDSAKENYQSVSYRDFRRMVITRCRAALKASDSKTMPKKAPLD